jgi:hypothetical protein
MKINSDKPDTDVQAKNEPVPAWMERFLLTPEEIESLREESLRSLEQMKEMRKPKSKPSE